MTDIEISQNCIPCDISDIAKKINLENDIILYGNSKAKIKPINFNKKAKLILVTAISPTPLGEGKTTVSIGLADALSSLGKKSVAVLREPSMGPVFGIKGGATGGGYSQVIPMEDINLHFTGDFHAITSACNLLSAAIDNHIYFGNKLNIKKVLFKRCLDVNDRSLRNVKLNSRDEEFTITAASEIMAIFCLANDLNDLKKRLGDIIIGIDYEDNYIFARDLNVHGAMTVLLKDAFMPNLVQTLEGTPAIIHGGPFANIAHGCNSVVASKIGLTVADYVVTEAGFGADLGAEKYLNIKCRNDNFSPNAVVLVCTIKALKFHGSDDNNKNFNSLDCLKNGLKNLKRHIDNILKFGMNVVVCLNKFEGDSDEDIHLLKNYCNECGVDFVVSTAYKNGSSGAKDLAKIILDVCDKPSKLTYSYNLNDSIINKIKSVACNLYHANDVFLTDTAIRKIKLIEKNGFSNLPICIAKTQYSFSDNPKLKGAPEDFKITVTDLSLYNGAGFITVLLGNMVVMPGLSREPAYEKIDLVDNEIIGLS